MTGAISNNAVDLVVDRIDPLLCLAVNLFPFNSTMIPPCDPSILEHNPQFKRLYENLTTHALDYNGSTRLQRADPAREAVVEVRRRVSAVTRTMGTSNISISTGPEAMPVPKCKKED